MATTPPSAASLLFRRIGIVQRVLAALVLRLVERLLDRRSASCLSASAALRHLLPSPPVAFARRGAPRPGRAPRGCRAMASCVSVSLSRILQAGGRTASARSAGGRGEARVLAHLERLRERACRPRSAAPGSAPGGRRGPRVSPPHRIRPLKRAGVGVAQVPGEAVEPGLGGELARGRGAAGHRRRPPPAGGLLGRRPCSRSCARPRPSASRNSSVTSSVVLRLRLQRVVDDGAVRAGSGRRPRGAAAARRSDRPGDGLNRYASRRGQRRRGLRAAGEMSSRIQNERPCVATTRSSPFTTRSVIGTTGRRPRVSSSFASGRAVAGQVHLQRLPARAVVERDVDAESRCRRRAGPCAPGPGAPRARTRPRACRPTMRRQVWP